VPPIFTDLFEIVDQHEARLIFTEVPRQFAMPTSAPTWSSNFLPLHVSL
jgi:hypothetical protein